MGLELLHCVLAAGEDRSSEFGKLVLGTPELEVLVGEFPDEGLVSPRRGMLRGVVWREGGWEERGGGEDEWSGFVADRLRGGPERVAFPWLRTLGALVVSATVVAGPLW